MWFLSNWKVILSFISTAALAYLLHALDVDRIEKKQERAIASQVSEDNKKCSEQKQITQEVSNEYERKISALNDELASVKLREPTRYIMPITKPTSRNYAGHNKPVHDKKDGVTSDALYEFAAEAEKYRIQLMSCQDFINKTWSENQ